MYLKRLEVYGFKTFAQRTSFDFPPGVTAVVGPNGSGKSNVADAVRWVLGEQSFANLRSKRTDDLIFGGGKGRAPMGFAEVFLTIDNSDRLLPLPYDEVTVGRRAYRNGENEYTINRARVRLRDVLDAVAPLGSSYTLINQGLVDSALALQPEERRRLFEDAAEIGPYQAKKNESERRLRETETNLLRLSDLVSELEPQLRTLKRQARDAEAVGAVEAELHELLHRFYMIQWKAVTAQLAAAQVEETRLAADLAGLRSGREDAAGQLLAEREQLRRQREVVEQCRTQLAEIRHQHESRTRELAVATERLAGFDQRYADVTQRQQQLQQRSSFAQEQTTRLMAQVTELEAAHAVESGQLLAAETALAREAEERRAAELAMTVQREAAVRALAAVETEQVRQHELERRYTVLAQQHDKLTVEIQQARERIQQHGNAVDAAQEVLSRAEQAIATTTKSLEALRRSLENARQERDSLDERITAAQRAHGELQARFDALTRLARSYEGTFAGVRAAMQWSERERRSGFMLVSSLLRVPPELETAIEVALGARLQHIVVERWADAEDAIAQLKRSGTGRATFLPLDTLRPGRRMSAPRLTGIRGIAADLVDIDDHYSLLGTYLLGRTLIADQLDAARQALPALEGGWTIVTLSGEQIATGGAVTGGAATKESGTLRRERELRDLPQRITEAQAVVEQLRMERSTVAQRMDGQQREQRLVDDQLRQARVARDTAQRTLEGRRRELHRAEDEANALLSRQQDLNGEQLLLGQQSTQIGDALVSARANHETMRQAAADAETAFNQLQAAASDEMAALAELRNQVAAFEAELRSRQAELRSQQQDVERAAREGAEQQQQASQIQNERQVVLQQVAAWREALDTLQTKLERATEQLQQAQGRLEQQEQALDLLEIRERELTTQTLALEAGHSEAAVELQRRLSERDTLWERAAEDNIDVEVISSGTSDEFQVTANRDDESWMPRIEQLRTRLRRMGPVNALAPQEYDAAQTRYSFLAEQLGDVRSAAATLRSAIIQLDQVMQANFETTFEAVAREFSQAFTQLFGGGSARLVLLDPSENGGSVKGIDILAQPPGKRQLNLQLLSGGERALTAAALLFAILTVNPSPFCILDEVDAALDEANVVRFREALLRLAEQTQFILITHNRGTVEAADTLYGITMAPDGASRMLSLRLEQVAEDGTLALGRNVNS